jgi:hypothetical protein
MRGSCTVTESRIGVTLWRRADADVCQALQAAPVEDALHRIALQRGSSEARGRVATEGHSLYGAAHKARVL